MLGRLRKKGQEGNKAAVQPKLLDNTRLVEIMRCFPIGGKIRFYPTLNDDLSFESIVIAYGINDHLVYTQNDIQVRVEEQETSFLLDDDWTDVSVNRVRSFCLLLPYVSFTETVLDYPSKAALMQGWQPFSRDERLTLISVLTDRGVPHLEVKVRKRVTLKDGYYANHAVVVLEVRPETLTLLDQRQHRRIKTLVPARISCNEKGQVYSGVLVDFSEYYAKLEFDMTGPLAEASETARYIYLTLELGEQDRTREYRLKGKVIRRGDGFVVMEFIGMRKDSQYMALEILDVLELKANLLQHPETQ